MFGICLVLYRVQCRLKEEKIKNKFYKKKKEISLGASSGAFTMQGILKILTLIYWILNYFY